MQTLIYCHSCEEYKMAWDDLRLNHSAFYGYLEKHWLDHCELFAGYARRGVLAFDNNTNNRLERYHSTIKSVTASSQISVGKLVDLLMKIVSVRSMSSSHNKFNEKFKTYRLPCAQLIECQKLLSKFAFDKLCSEYERSLVVADKVIDVGDEHQYFKVGIHDVTLVSCSCDSFTNYLIPCRHVFYVRRVNEQPLYDKLLVSKRWLRPACLFVCCLTAHQHCLGH